MGRKPREDAMDRRLRWMREKVSGAYHAKHEHNPSPPEDQSGHCTNSGTCIIVCCYINGLGKVLWKEQQPKPIKESHDRELTLAFSKVPSRVYERFHHTIERAK